MTLTNLQKKDILVWNSVAESAFEMLKQAMCSTHVHALPDFFQPFVIETYAIHEWIGSILVQHKRPLVYISKAIGMRNMELSMYENELLTLVASFNKWRHYLKGYHFIVKNDHQALKFLLD